ncbi:hypothetical protein BC936DRAFT_139090 [Jimgerdemannia flammicorona]|uniref:Uncharacterized protein n=1 Tax=Jimgerdemannia flammicorona TaxID=994334 RepID=A0A433DI20_9FUNG|nr:hypothetical protein BC936DRAFT_139090 [Jimgerdemannia flammicorona]
MLLLYTSQDRELPHRAAVCALSMHLTAINPILGWVYIAENALLGVVGLFGILSALVASFALMKWYARAFWVTTAVTLLWETASFVLAYTRSQETIDSCRSQLLNLANTTVIGNVAPVSKNDTEAQTYGEATCEASVKAGMIAIGVILLVGQILQMYFGLVISSYVSQLREQHRGHRLRDTDWDRDESVVDLAERNQPPTHMAANPLHK